MKEGVFELEVAEVSYADLQTTSKEEKIAMIQIDLQGTFSINVKQKRL